MIYYLDGFGVSTYEDQVLLLHNISKWLKLYGLCVIEVYNPTYWKKVDGRSMKLSEDLLRKYSFDYKTNSFMDTWTSLSEKTSYTQVLQCYSPEEMKDMLGHTDMKIVSIHPGGAMDFEKWEYNPRVSLEECLNYQIVFSK